MSARAFGIHGSQFGAAVSHPGDAAEPVEQKRRLPDGVVAILQELQPSPAEKQEWNDLIADRISLNERTLDYIERKLSARREDLEAKHEDAKRAVVQQQNVLEQLKASMDRDQQEVVRSQNELSKAQSQAFLAAQGLKELSRFASRKDREAHERRVESADRKLQTAERAAAELVQALNFAKTATWPREKRKLDDLIVSEMELDTVLRGGDPASVGLGFLPR